MERSFIENFINLNAADDVKPDYCSLLCTGVHCCLVTFNCSPSFDIDEESWPFPKVYVSDPKEYSYQEIKFTIVILRDAIDYFVLCECGENYSLILCPELQIPFFDNFDTDETKLSDLKNIINRRVIMNLWTKKTLPVRSKAEKYLLVFQFTEEKEDATLYSLTKRFVRTLPPNFVNQNEFDRRSMFVSLLCFLYSIETGFDFSKTERIHWGGENVYNEELINFKLGRYHATFSVLEFTDYFFVVFRSGEDQHLISEFKINSNYTPSLMNLDFDRYCDNLRIQVLSSFVNNHATKFRHFCISGFMLLYKLRISVSLMKTVDRKRSRSSSTSSTVSGAPEFRPAMYIEMLLHRGLDDENVAFNRVEEFLADQVQLADLEHRDDVLQDDNVPLGPAEEAAVPRMNEPQPGPSRHQ